MISIHAPREGCDGRQIDFKIPSSISIHAPREGCDCEWVTRNGKIYQISIHAPREGCDRRPPLFGAWSPPISIHAPREGCDGGKVRVRHEVHISIHAPREGCDDGQPVPVHRGDISIHAPREGCDPAQGGCCSKCADFNPRTPRGVRPRRGEVIDYLVKFQSTHPARGATTNQSFFKTPQQNFNPRTPRGVRQQTLPKSREFAWLNLLICTRGRRLSIQKQTRLCSIKLSFMLFGCEPAGEGVSSWTSHATKSKVRLEGRSA